MQAHISKIYQKWALENHRHGALGFILRDYLQGHEITLHGYNKCVELLRAQYPEFTKEYRDWYLPSIIENVMDWEYSEERIYAAVVKSTEPELWQYMFPYVLSLLPLFNIDATLRWLPILKKWPTNLQRHFYNHIDQGSILIIISDELRHTTLKNIDILRLETCLISSYVATNITVWDEVWEALNILDWQGFEEAYRNVSWLWIQRSPFIHNYDYVTRATKILCSPLIQWQNVYILEILRRNHYADDNGQTILKIWSHLDSDNAVTSKEIPWLFILNNWYIWDIEALASLVNGTSSLQLQMQSTIVSNNSYSHDIRKNILIYRCANNFIVLNDFEKFRLLPSTLTHILIFWVLFRNDSLPKEWAKLIQDIYSANPNYEYTKLAQWYLPGFMGIRHALLSMDITWANALAYTETAMQANKEVHASLRKELIDVSTWNDGAL